MYVDISLCLVAVFEENGNVVEKHVMAENAFGLKGGVEKIGLMAFCNGTTEAADSKEGQENCSIVTTLL